MDVDLPAAQCSTKSGVISRMKPASATISTLEATAPRRVRLVEGFARREGLVVDGGRRDAPAHAAQAGRHRPCSRPRGRFRPDSPVRVPPPPGSSCSSRARRSGSATRLARSSRVGCSCVCSKRSLRIATASGFALALGVDFTPRPGSITSPMTTGASPAAFRAAMHHVDPRLGDHDHADAAVEGAQHLLVVEAASLGEPAEHRRQGPTGKVDVGGEAVWQHARQVLGQAAAGDVRQRLDGAGPDPPPPVARDARRAPASRRCASASAAPRPAVLPAAKGAGASHAGFSFATSRRTSE